MKLNVQMKSRLYMRPHSGLCGYHKRPRVRGIYFSRTPTLSDMNNVLTRVMETQPNGMLKKYYYSIPGISQRVSSDVSCMRLCLVLSLPLRWSIGENPLFTYLDNKGSQRPVLAEIQVSKQKRSGCAMIEFIDTVYPDARTRGNSAMYIRFRIG